MLYSLWIIHVNFEFVNSLNHDFNTQHFSLTSNRELIVCISYDTTLIQSHLGTNLFFVYFSYSRGLFPFSYSCFVLTFWTLWQFLQKLLNNNWRHCSEWTNKYGNFFSSRAEKINEKPVHSASKVISVYPKLNWA